MRAAVYPGSFDPVTNGHIEILRSAVALFDQVVVLVARNTVKHYSFDAEERAEMLERCTAAFGTVSVQICDELVATYARNIGAAAIVKGVRAMSDFDAEFQQALANRQISPFVETIFIPASGGSMFLSSSMVKEICSFGGDISAFVPSEALPQICSRLKINIK